MAIGVDTVGHAGRPGRALVGLIGALVFCCAASAQAVDVEAARAAVDAAERSFARSMAERDFDAFARHLAPDAVFFGPGGPLRGRQAVLDGWRGFFEGEQAPFSWEPDQVEIAGNGDLAHSSGPVRDPTGKAITRFNSVWQRSADGTWQVVFDRGDPPCRCDPPAPAADGD